MILNLMQQDSSAARATMRVAYAVGVPVTEAGSAGYPFAVLNAAA